MTSKTATLTTDIVLFDLDGTLVNTTLVVEKLWGDLCEEHGVNKEHLFQYSHGTRTSEVFSNFFPMIDNTNDQAVIKFEKHIPDTHGDLVKLIPGCVELLNGLNKDKWCIVTSGGRYIAYSWFNGILSNVQKPNVFITSELVSQGKPNPEGYLKGVELLKKNLNIDSDVNVKRVVFEDAPVGIRAGVAAGAVVVGVSSGFNAEKLYEAGATYVVQDLTKVRIIDGEKITLEVDFK